jgi:DNA invertase Pin-like site-specific DNA recombinase
MTTSPDVNVYSTSMASISAAVLKRVSTDLNRQEITNQDADTAKVVSDNALTVVRTFELEASAYHGEHQPTLDQIKSDVRTGLYSVVVIAMTSRIERRGHRTLLRFLWDLSDLGARVIAADNPAFGTDGLMGDLLTMLQGNSDHEYSKKISENVNRAFLRTDKENAFRGVVPTGYTAEGTRGAKRLVPSDGVCRCPTTGTKYHNRCRITSQQVAEAIKLCASGSSTVILGKRLGMSATATRRLIENPIYGTGRYEIKRADGSTYAHRCEPLVDPGLQKQAIAAIKARSCGDNVSSRSIRKEDFSGAMWCPYCATEAGSVGRMYRALSGKQNRRYRCDTCLRTVKADEADKAIHQEYASDESRWFRMRVIPGSDHSAELARLRDELDGLGARRLPRSEMLAETTRLYDEIERLEAMPSEPTRTVLELVKDASGRAMSEGQHWELMDMRERREWILSRAAASHFPTLKAASTPAGRRPTGAVELKIVYAPDRDEMAAEAA